MLFRRQLSYSAGGEDRLALAWLETVYGLQPSRIRYCDIGANHPKQLSNTFIMYECGATGVLVEPDPDMCRLLRRTRPRDEVINVGVAFDDQRSAKLRRFNARVFNTFSADQAELVLASSAVWQPDQRQELVDEIVVALEPANDILGRHFADGLHFLSIDAEGVDYPILRSIDLGRFRPKLICVEASLGEAAFDELLNPHGYHVISRSPDNFLYRLVE